MAFGFFLFSAVDTMAKFLTDSLHPFQIVWMRQAGLGLAMVVILAVRGWSILRTRHLGLQIARGILASISAVFFIFALRYVALADAIAISFVAPFLVTVLGAALLGEKVGIRRWSAVAVGFLGALIILRPGLGVMHPASGLVLVAATAFAFRQIISRRLGNNDPTITTVAYTALTSSLLLLVPLPFVWITPGPGLWPIILGVAVLAALAETMIIRALELAEAVVLAPVHYSLLIWGTMYGWLVFGDLPDRWTWIGAAIIVVTGIYMLHRERLAARR